MEETNQQTIQKQSIQQQSIQQQTIQQSIQHQTIQQSIQQQSIHQSNIPCKAEETSKSNQNSVFPSNTDTVRFNDNRVDAESTNVTNGTMQTYLTPDSSSLHQPPTFLTSTASYDESSPSIPNGHHVNNISNSCQPPCLLNGKQALSDSKLTPPIKEDNLSTSKPYFISYNIDNSSIEQRSVAGELSSREGKKEQVVDLNGIPTSTSVISHVVVNPDKAIQSTQSLHTVCAAADLSQTNKQISEVNGKSSSDGLSLTSSMQTTNQVPISKSVQIIENGTLAKSDFLIQPETSPTGKSISLWNSSPKATFSSNGSVESDRVIGPISSGIIADEHNSAKTSFEKTSSIKIISENNSSNSVNGLLNSSNSVNGLLNSSNSVNGSLNSNNSSVNGNSTGCVSSLTTKPLEDGDDDTPVTEIHSVAQSNGFYDNDVATLSHNLDLHVQSEARDLDSVPRVECSSGRRLPRVECSSGRRISPDSHKSPSNGVKSPSAEKTVCDFKTVQGTENLRESESPKTNSHCDHSKLNLDLTDSPHADDQSDSVFNSPTEPNVNDTQRHGDGYHDNSYPHRSRLSSLVAAPDSSPTSPIHRSMSFSSEGESRSPRSQVRQGAHNRGSAPSGWTSAPPQRTVSTPNDIDQVKGQRSMGRSTTHQTSDKNGTLRKMAARSASVLFNCRTGLPSQSSPAPLKRKSGGKFDYDANLVNTKAIKNAFSCSKLSSHQDNQSEDGQDGRQLSTSAPASTNCLLGNFEESILNGRIDPIGTVQGFTAEIGASGSFCPRHLHAPVSAFFFALSDDNAPSPYLGHVDLQSVSQKGYHIPRKGTVQVTLFNPNKTVVKMFVVTYDLGDMPPASQTFVRQRTVYQPVDPNSDQPAFLRYLIHLRVASSRSGKIYLHTDIRLIFARHKPNVDAKSVPYTLKSFTEVPQNPKYSPKK